jgi:phage tail-like protein
MVTLTLLDHASNPVRAWSFADAFPVRWAGPTLSANVGAIAAEELELAHGGMSVMEV